MNAAAIIILAVLLAVFVHPVFIALLLLLFVPALRR